MDQQDNFGQADLGVEELRRRAGGTPPGSSEAVRQRLAALLQAPPLADDAAPATSADDIRRCGGVIVRLGGAATATTIATWMGWTLERTASAVAEVDRRLWELGLELVADAEAGLHIHERVGHRARPHRPSIELLERLDDAAHRHGLAHLVRADPCGMAGDWMQPLFDLGAAVAGQYPGAEPCQGLGAAFAGVRRRVAFPSFTVIGGSGRPWPKPPIMIVADR